MPTFQPADNHTGKSLNVIHQHNDKTWWFWDEVGSEECGPYDDETAARNAAQEYADIL